ncbi:hypothetical protein [Geodermatophilus sp. SYSU D00710]
MTEPASELQTAADYLSGLTAAEHEALLARSAREYAEGEGRPEPLHAYRWDGLAPVHRVPPPSAEVSPS